MQAVLALAGLSYTVLPGSLWWASIPRTDWPPTLAADLGTLWQEPYGDRQQEFVVIGLRMDGPSARAAFESCLLTDAEMEGGVEGWAKLDDPFPLP